MRWRAQRHQPHQFSFMQQARRQEAPRQSALCRGVCREVLDPQSQRTQRALKVGLKVDYFKVRFKVRFQQRCQPRWLGRDMLTLICFIFFLFAYTSGDSQQSFVKQNMSPQTILANMKTSTLHPRGAMQKELKNYMPSPDGISNGAC